MPIAAKQPPVEVFEGDTNVSLVFAIPPLPIDVAVINIRRNGEVGLAFVNNILSVTIQDPFKNRVVPTPDTQKRNLTLTFKSIQKDDAGTYKCIKGLLDDSFENCGARLIIIREC